ncbi:MAG: tetratricopeptide repeat protein [Planctomycetota bacterium]|jgi:Flp pilus assembly protein TadD
MSRSAEAPAEEEAGKNRGPWIAIAAIAVVGLLIWGFFQWGGGISGTQYPRVSMKPAEERSAEDTRYLNLLAEARAEFGQQRYVNALMKISAAQQSTVADSEANLLSARINLARDEDVSVARKDLEDALSLDPDYAEAALELGWLEFSLGDLGAAREQFQKVESLENEAVSAEGGLGAIAFQEGEPVAAEALLQAGSNAKNASSREFLYLGRCQVKLGDPQTAIDSFIEAKRRDPSSWEAVSDLGEAYLRVGDVGKAETQLNQAIELDAVRAIVAQGALASMLISQGRHEDAMLVLDPALQVHPNAGPLHILKGAALQGTGNREGAIRALEKGLANTPDAQAWVLLGLLHHDAGNLEQAVQAYNSALDVDGANAKALLQLGLVLFAQEDYERAGARFQSAVDRDPDDAYARLCLGIYLMDFSADPASARPQFEAYQALGGTDSRVNGWLNNLRD